MNQTYQDKCLKLSGSKAYANGTSEEKNIIITLMLSLMRRKNEAYQINEEYRALPNEMARKIGDLLPLTKQEKIIEHKEIEHKDYNLRVFAINYNIFRIMSGMGNLTYSN